MAKKRNRITAAMSQTIAESSPLIKKTKTVSSETANNNVVETSLDLLEDNPYQPRIDINLHTLNELISSIEQNGLLQPIVITTKKDNGMHTIVAGHRRCEAFKIMGKKHIPTVILKDLVEKDLAILSLTENIMRENLHPIENAIAIQNILNEKLVESQNKLAEYVGLSKGYVSKLMNILKLPSTLIQQIKKDNYKDINILVLLNKLVEEEKILTVYEHIKNMSRGDAEKYIKINHLSPKSIKKSIFEIKSSNTKININIDIKKLTDEQIKLLNQEIKDLDKSISNLLKKWEE